MEKDFGKEIDKTREEEIKQKVTKISKLLYRKNLTSSTGGNICLKDRDLFYITPHGMGREMLYEIEPKDIMILDKDLNILSGKKTAPPSVEAKLHIDILSSLSDYNASIHAHTYYSSVFAYAGMEIPIKSQVMDYYVGRQRIVEAAKCGSSELSEACLEKVMEIKDERKDRTKTINIILEKHGIVTIAKNIEAAVASLEAIEQAAQYEIFSKLIRK